MTKYSEITLMKRNIVYKTLLKTSIFKVIFSQMMSVLQKKLNEAVHVAQYKKGMEAEIAITQFT